MKEPAKAKPLSVLHKKCKQSCTSKYV